MTQTPMDAWQFTPRGIRLDPECASDEIMDWKKAGMAEEVIRSALEAED